MLSVGLLGGTGYTGKKLIQFCHQHPYISSFEVYANSTAEESLWNLFPDLADTVENIKIKSINDISLEHDVYFVTLPHGHSLKYTPLLIDNGKTVIDLGGDYRLDFEELYRQWYNLEHTSVYLLNSKVYGLADFLPAEKYKDTQLIANPGCYPTAVLLALLPFAENFSENILSVSTVAYSGTSGAGKAPRQDLMISEMSGNVKAYSVNKHRHEPEILQMLYSHKFCAPFSFTAHLLPVAAGIYATTSIHLRESIDVEDVLSVYKKAYDAKPFVRLRKAPPELKWVIDTNFCDIFIAVEEKKVIVISAIDNLVKGAAGQAIQNMNILYGWDETTGLKVKEYCHAIS
ncbi:MAG: N-acetyl-gamma-glutamyl-phosphate reductase [Bacteroidota bacterium]|nr:N-acetyl-gamma-glutamyl-phosphate reductase [Bacteroidota bacterium]